MKCCLNQTTAIILRVSNTNKVGPRDLTLDGLVMKYTSYYVIFFSML